MQGTHFWMYGDKKKSIGKFEEEILIRRERSSLTVFLLLKQTK